MITSDVSILLRYDEKINTKSWTFHYYNNVKTKNRLQTRDTDSGWYMCTESGFSIKLQSKNFKIKIVKIGRKNIYYKYLNKYF